MKTLLKLPLSIVRVIIAIVALLIGALVVLAGIVAFTDYKNLFAKSKSDNDRT